MQPGIRMRDVARLTQMPPSTIHFYIRAGLLPQPVRTSQNQALYGQEFVDRVRLIKLLQEQAHLPLAEIRDALENVSTESVRHMPSRIEVVMRNAIAAMQEEAGDGKNEALSAENLAQKGVSPADLAMLTGAQLITPVDHEGTTRFSPLDAEVAVAFVRVREALGSSIAAMMPIFAVFGTHLKSMSKVEAAQAARIFLEASSDQSSIRAADHDYLRSLSQARDEFVHAVHRRELAQAFSELIGF